MRDLPGAVLTPVDLGRTHDVGSRHAVDGGSDAFQASGVGSVPEHLGGQQLEVVGSALLKPLGQAGEELVELVLPVSVLGSAQNTDRVMS